MKQWTKLLRAEDWRELPFTVYRELVSHLYRTPASVNGGDAVLAAVIGALAYSRSQDPWLVVLTTLTVLLMMAYIPVTSAARAECERASTAGEIRRVERRLEWHGWAISLGIGVMAARGVLNSTDPVVHLTLGGLALGATTTNIRYHFRPRLAFGRTIAINAPVVAAGFYSGSSYSITIAVGAIIAVKVFLDISIQLYSSSLALLLAFREKDMMTQALEATNAELKERERQRNEAQAELQGVQAELIHVSRISAMGTMASTLAHELNQPLTAVTNYLSGSRKLLQSDKPKSLDGARKAMEAAEASATRAALILRRLRSLVFRGDIETRVEDLPELIKAACDLAFLDARLKAVEHSFDFDPDARLVEVDGIQVQQVVINLVRNAMEAMVNSEHRHVLVATHGLSDEFVRVSVTDSGPGLSSADLDMLFSTFQSRKAEGLGLGLSICRTIVEAHGGRIWAEQRAGEGATFHLTLRRAGKAAERPEVMAA